MPQKEEEVLNEPSLPQGKLRTAAVRKSYFGTECRFTLGFFASQEQARGADQQAGGWLDQRLVLANPFPTPP